MYNKLCDIIILKLSKTTYFIITTGLYITQKIYLYSILYTGTPLHIYIDTNLDVDVYV